MAGNYTTITKRPDDRERKDAHKMGIGGYGGEDSKKDEIRQKTLPSGES